MITGEWNIDTTRFRGKSGKIYLQNPMTKKFSTYQDSVKRENWLGLTAMEEAYADAEEVPTAYETWMILTPMGESLIECADDGTVGETDIMTIIREEIEKHGREAVNATKCTTTN